MTKSTLTDRLETGVAADIFYDVSNFDDISAVNTIEDFQSAVDTAVDALKRIAAIDTTGTALSADDLAALRDIQKSLQK